MNARELKAQMVRKGLSSAEMAKEIGIGITTFYKKIRGVSEFTQGEIAAMVRILSLSAEDTNEIFFSEKVS